MKLGEIFGMDHECYFCGKEVEDGGFYDKEMTMWIGIECGCDDKPQPIQITRDKG